MATLRITVPLLKVLQVFIAKGCTERLYGLELADQTGLRSGTLYPILARLEEAGWVTSMWEDTDPHEAGRPRRRYYQLTGLGQRAGIAALGELSQLSTLADRQHQSSRPAWGQA